MLSGGILKLIPGAGAFIDIIKGFSSTAALAVASFLAIIRKTLAALKTLLDKISDLLGIDVSCRADPGAGAGRAEESGQAPVQSVGGSGGSDVVDVPGGAKGAVDGAGGRPSHESFLDKSSTAAGSSMVCAIIDFFSGNFLMKGPEEPPEQRGGNTPGQDARKSETGEEQESSMMDYLTDFATLLEACFKSWFKKCNFMVGIRFKTSLSGYLCRGGGHRTLNE